jgi:hypothetical protein
MESHTLGEVTAQNAENYSDRFPFLQNYGGRTRDFVFNNFSETFVNALDRLDPSPRWVGPIDSPFGFHVVQLRSRQESYLPALDAIRPRVEDDYVYVSIRRGSSTLVDALVSEYEVIVDLGQGENVSSSDANN